ncbi:hypothetical protein QAD02_009649 [Eretmocerus hayati]|uniref:Uncharacterized protein n=1 Tax=Eretmocerus hayati TaxID=131215 RepID=A0ACC2NAA5_9HYME|nr:hypothetical protein QAD02_009649 [Eretmocerus hayati]
MKSGYWSLFLLVCVAVPAILAKATDDVSQSNEADLWDDDGHDFHIREVRSPKASGGGGENSPSCRYSKGQWSECDPKTNMRTRSLTLKKGDGSCEKAKTITKKCKKGKACRYEKGQWSSCVNQHMTRVDNLKANSDDSCEKSRRQTKKCKPGNMERKGVKDRSNKKNNKQQ